MTLPQKAMVVAVGKLLVVVLLLVEGY